MNFCDRSSCLKTFEKATTLNERVPLTTQVPPVRTTLETLAASHLHCRVEPLGPLILEILCCGPKGRRALLRIPSTEGRGVRLCWAHSKPKESKFTIHICTKHVSISCRKLVRN